MWGGMDPSGLYGEYIFLDIDHPAPITPRSYDPWAHELARIERQRAESDAEALREWREQGYPSLIFTDCDDDQQRQIRPVVAAAYDAIQETNDLVRGRGIGVIPPGRYRYVNDAMLRQFPRLEDKQTHQGWVEEYTTSLAINARQILEGMRDGITIECECDCDMWPKPGSKWHYIVCR